MNLRLHFGRVGTKATSPTRENREQIEADVLAESADVVPESREVTLQGSFVRSAGRRAEGRIQGERSEEERVPDKRRLVKRRVTKWGV